MGRVASEPEHSRCAVVIPNYNRGAETCRLLKSIHSQATVPEDVVVVDDASTDDSRQRIKAEFPAVRLLCLERNSGPSVARHAGFTSVCSEFIVGIDSDVILPAGDFFSEIGRTFDKQRDVDCLAFRVLLDQTGSDDVGRWWHSPPVQRAAAQEFDTHYFSGTAFAIRQAVYQNIEGFPSDLFMFNEEVEVALQLLRRGSVIRYTPRLFVHHLASLRARNNRIPFYYKRRNQLLMVAKYYTVWRGVVFWIPRMGKTLLSALYHGEAGKPMRAVWQARKLVLARLSHRTPLPPIAWKRLRALKQLSY